MYVNWTVCSFILVFCADFICVPAALNIDDKGVCVVKLSSRRTRQRAVQVTINKLCGRKKCVVKKTRNEAYVVTTNHTVCCHGWEYKSEDDICTPLCTTGCFGGRCVSPDTCECDPPYTLHAEHKNTCVIPLCEPSCINSECTSTHTCTCKKDFVPYNSTACFPVCAKNYELSENLKCVPKCDSCQNGICFAPGECRCHDGYEIKDGGCVPICENCVNSYCVEPNVCECYDEFERLNETVCRPKCNCKNGYCSELNECICDEGYTKTNDTTCEPFCDEPCVNGFCFAPGVCLCHEGFVRNDSRPEVCYKPCPERCEGSCDLQGECIEDDCRKPKKQEVKKTSIETFRTKQWCGKQKCTKTRKRQKWVTELMPICCQGWVYNSNNDTCSAECRSGCNGGHCVAPNTCQCIAPLILVNNNTCTEPTCEQHCVNGQCVGPNQCGCKSGYTALNSTHCAPNCDLGYYNDEITLNCTPKCQNVCENASCTAPDICTCLDGYQKQEGDKFTCIPSCNPACVDAECIAPNTCSCHEGYLKEDEFKCSPVCDECSDGECVGPNNCKCNDGYQKVNGRCQPKCNETCVNGFCSKPDTCSCNTGFQITTDKYHCLPICDNKCVNGICSSPNKCTCLDGYVPINEWTCKPYCQNCENGVCTEPDFCQCLEGYSKINDKCTPVCNEECTNGYCSKPNKCSCNKGYELDENNKFICNPICDNNCTNGICIKPNICKCLPGYESVNSFICEPKCDSCEHGKCVAPETCECEDGYKRKKDRCHPVCQNPCVNGLCIAPDECVCNTGYVKNESNHFSCFKPCDTQCLNGTCLIDGTCHCNFGFVLENNICVSIEPVECSSCNGTCSDGRCVCLVDGRPCYMHEEEPLENTSNTSLAGLNLAWLVGACLCLLLIVIIVLVITKIWRKSQKTNTKTVDQGPFGSVVYTVPDTLIRNGYRDVGVLPEEEIDLESCDEAADTSDKLLDPEGHHDVDKQDSDYGT